MYWRREAVHSGEENSTSKSMAVRVSGVGSLCEGDGGPCTKQWEVGVYKDKARKCTQQQVEECGFIVSV